jgi:DNA-binding response OmpR family regulator
MNAPRVLVVDDDRGVHAKLRRALSDKVMLISALSIKTAKEKFAKNPDVAAIVMDACVPGNSSTTLPLVCEIRKTFTGPMIAASGSEHYRQQLLRAGCNYESEKDALPAKILSVLNP